MMIDAKFDFGLPAITNSTTQTVSTNVLDMEADVILFGSQEPLFMWGRATITADASPTFRCDLVASDNADLDPNNNETIRNIILASTGVIQNDPTDGLALADGDVIEFSVPIQQQRAARQYYGGLITLGGTNPDLAAGDLYVLSQPQTNMIGARAAVPA